MVRVFLSSPFLRIGPLTPLGKPFVFHPCWVYMARTGVTPNPLPHLFFSSVRFTLLLAFEPQFGFVFVFRPTKHMGGHPCLATPFRIKFSFLRKARPPGSQFILAFFSLPSAFRMFPHASGVRYVLPAHEQVNSRRAHKSETHNFDMSVRRHMWRHASRHSGICSE